LPLAHGFALLIQPARRPRRADRLLRGDTKAIVGELMEVKRPTCRRPAHLPRSCTPWPSSSCRRPSWTRSAPSAGQIQDLEVRGAAVPQDLRDQFAELQPKADFVKDCSAGASARRSPARRRSARDPGVLLGCGIPVMEGYGMTETSTVATSSRRTRTGFGSSRQAADGRRDQDRRGRRAADQAPTSSRLLQNDDASFGAVDDGWLHTGDLGSVDADGYVSITGRRDIIITAGGKNLTPAT